MTNEENQRCAINYLIELKKSTKGYGANWLDLAIKALEQTRWIPCSERLPKNREDVLAFDGSDYFVAWFDKVSGWHSSDDTFDRYTPIRVWMPLPQPYEAESEDEE